LLLFHKKLADILQKAAFLIYADLIISMAILMIGGGWRSSYFVYTMTTIMLFAIFYNVRGAFVSAVLLAITAFIKDPSGGLPDIEVFHTTKLDMQLGASIAYIIMGLTLGYIRLLLNKIEKLTEIKIENNRQIASLEEKERLALELHDGAKQMANALVLKMHPLVKSAKTLPKEVADELSWFWRGINYLQSELKQVVNTLKTGKDEGSLVCCVKTLAEEEARIVEIMTGFTWQVAAESETMPAPIKAKTPLRRFIGEALINAWKHSGVMNGRIELKKVNNGICLEIIDFGKGFILPGSPETQTTGLQSLAHRAKELKAQWMIDTEPGRGCKITLILPNGVLLENSQK
jgi:signal transduction histidine kinase